MCQAPSGADTNNRTIPPVGRAPVPASRSARPDGDAGRTTGPGTACAREPDPQPNSRTGRDRSSDSVRRSLGGRRDEKKRNSNFNFHNGQRNTFSRVSPPAATFPACGRRETFVMPRPTQATPRSQQSHRASDTPHRAPASLPRADWPCRLILPSTLSFSLSLCVCVCSALPRPGHRAATTSGRHAPRETSPPLGPGLPTTIAASGHSSRNPPPRAPRRAPAPRAGAP